MRKYVGDDDQPWQWLLVSSKPGNELAKTSLSAHEKRQFARLEANAGKQKAEAKNLELFGTSKKREVIAKLKKEDINKRIKKAKVLETKKKAKQTESKKKAVPAKPETAKAAPQKS